MPASTSHGWRLFCGVNRTLQIFFAVAVLALPAGAFAQNLPPANSVYGAFPKNYQEIVTAWLNSNSIDPESAKIKWLGEPRPGELSVSQTQKVAGFLVDFTLNARNIFGAYTGPQKHTALIRDGQVVTATGFVAR